MSNFLMLSETARKGDYIPVAWEKQGRKHSGK